MKCLMKYQWVKLPRNHMPEGKGILGAWARLASRAAFRKGKASYCGHSNAVTPGMWAGGVVGLKSILDVRRRIQALETLEKLAQEGYVQYDLDRKTKKLTYQMTDWVVECAGKECMEGAVYATDEYGFLCLPRSITERLVAQNYVFGEADAWLDLWCHSVYREPDNAFSYPAPAIQYGKFGAILTLETLGQRWGWEKTKVWRFFQKHGDVFVLYRLPGSYGCLIFNKLYPIDKEVSLPAQGEVLHILEQIRIYSANVQRKGSDHEHLCRMTAWYSRKLTGQEHKEAEEFGLDSRVALFDPIIRAYLSLYRNCKNCEYDCRKVNRDTSVVMEANDIRGPCEVVDLTNKHKEYLEYEQTG